MIFPAWMALTGAGVLLGGVLPPSLRLDLAAPLTFLLLLLPWPACSRTWDPRCWPAITVPAFVAPHGAIAFAETAPALLAAAAAWRAWRTMRRNLPIALFGGLAVWWISSWAVTAAVGLGLGPS